MLRLILITGILFSSLLLEPNHADSRQDWDDRCDNRQLARSEDGVEVWGNYFVLITALSPNDTFAYVEVFQDPRYPDLAIPRCPNASFSPDERYLAVSANGLHILDTTTWEELSIPALETTTSQSFGELVWDESSRYLVYEDAFQIYRLDMETGESTVIVPEQEQQQDWPVVLLPLQFSPDASWLSFEKRFYEGGSINLVNAETGDVVLSEFGYVEWACSKPIWHPNLAALVALSCHGLYQSPEPGIVYICPLAETGECQAIEMSGGGRIRGWVDDEHVLVSWDIDWVESDDCYLVSTKEWELADCDAPLVESDEATP